MGSRRPLWLIAALALLALAVARPAAAKTADVRLPGTTFDPKSVGIRSGDTVRWTYADPSGRNHTITSQAGEAVQFDSHPNCSSLLQLNCFNQGDDPFAQRFDVNSTVTVDYYCKIHGSRTQDPDGGGCGMCGKIRIVAEEEPTPEPTQTRPEPRRTQGSDQAQQTPAPGPTVTATASPAQSPGAGGDGELAAGPDGGGSGGGRLGLAFLFLLMLGFAARVVYRHYILDPFAARQASRPGRDPRNPLF